MKKQPVISAAKLRAIADRLERDTSGQVAELRRLADLLDGVNRVTRTKTARKKTKRAKARLTPAARKKLKAERAKVARKAASRKRAIDKIAKRAEAVQTDIEDFLAVGRKSKAAGRKPRAAKKTRPRKAKKTGKTKRAKRTKARERSTRAAYAKPPAR